MYNEVKRFYLFRRRRWVDTLFDTLYHVIFILGFYSLLRKILTFSCPISIIISSWPKWFPWAMKSWSTRFGRGNPSAFSMLCNQCIEFTFNELWFTLFGLLCLVVFDFLGCSAFDSSGLTNSLFFEGHQFPRVARSTDWFPDFSRLLSCHDSTNHPFPTDFSLDRFSKHRALILLRTRLSSGEFWEFEEIIWWDYKKLKILFRYRVLFLLKSFFDSYSLREWRWYTPLIVDSEKTKIH